VRLQDDGEPLVRLERRQRSRSGGHPVSAFGLLVRAGPLAEELGEDVVPPVASRNEHALSGPAHGEGLTAGDDLHPGGQGEGRAVGRLREEDLDRALKRIVGIVGTQGEAPRRAAELRLGRAEDRQRPSLTAR
jgi:hypothetical protein